jgi:hypothetical protein
LIPMEDGSELQEIYRAMGMKATDGNDDETGEEAVLA